MPRGDGTGPMGMGPKTGRGAGICAGFTAPGYVNPIGLGCGLGGGCGFRKTFYATGLPRFANNGVQNTNKAYTSEVDEKELLKRQANQLENQLNDVKKRIASFDEGTKE